MKSVVLETEWFLRSLHRLYPARFAAAVEALISLANVRCVNETEVRKALAWHQAGMDFADALSVASRSQATRLATFGPAMIKAAKRLRLPVSTP